MEQKISRFPLEWPVGWKRTASYAQKDGKFKRFGKPLSVYDGIQRVIAELERMGIRSDDVVISSNVPTRLDGLPRSDARKPADCGVAVYWRKNGKTQCIAVDRYDDVPDNLAAIAATLEAMRAIERHGGASILDRAFMGFTALPAPPQWWQDLELDRRPTTRGEIDKRHRELISKYHPDRHPNGHEMAARVNAARDRGYEEIRA